MGPSGCRPLLALGDTLRNLAGIDQRVSNVGGEVFATYPVAERADDVVAAHHVDFRAGREKRPAMLDQVDKTLAVIVMHVGEKDRTERTEAKPGSSVLDLGALAAIEQQQVAEALHGHAGEVALQRRRAAAGSQKSDREGWRGHGEDPDAGEPGRLLR